MSQYFYTTTTYIFIYNHFAIPWILLQMYLKAFEPLSLVFVLFKFFLRSLLSSVHSRAVFPYIR
jgi:hypothetical protein